jgi:hypothetical protein
MVDVNKEFHALWGRVQICGIEYKAAEVLASYDPDAYEAAVNNYALSKGYYLDPDTDQWFSSYEDYAEEMRVEIEPLDFSGVSNEDR